ncbi:unnamed protein product, partial [Rotaria socialis]
MAATQFKIVSSLDQGDLHMILLEETTPPFPLLQPVPIVGSLPMNSNPSGEFEIIIRVQCLLNRDMIEHR